MACTGTGDKSEHAAWITGAACRCICNAKHVVHDIWRTLYSEMKPQNGVIELSAGGKQVMRSCGEQVCEEQYREECIMNEEIVLCAASAYEQKFYLNPEFDSLPENIRQELQVMCVLYTEDVGGILMLVFDEKGNLELKVDHKEDDFFFDEIGSVLKIKELQQTKRELFESLELFFKVFYLGEDIEDNQEN